MGIGAEEVEDEDILLLEWLPEGPRSNEMSQKGSTVVEIPLACQNNRQNMLLSCKYEACTKQIQTADSG